MRRNYINIGKRLKEIRINDEKISNKQAMADLLNVTVEYYDLVERGKYPPNVEMLVALNKKSKDIDYIITGKKSEQSVFNNILCELSNNEKNEIEKLLIYKLNVMRGILSTETKIRTKAYTPYERIKDIVARENNYQRISNSMLANVLDISERTVNRLNNEESDITTDNVFTIYDKYGYFPSYILCGELNSNSKVDQIYRMMDENDKDTLMSCAKELAAYFKAGKGND